MNEKSNAEIVLTGREPADIFVDAAEEAKPLGTTRAVASVNKAPP